ncbi:phosphatidylinositol 3 and 4-kinase-domain-containing protein [Syncephalis plumigaleata]|nr:phosphatidylinositol 3 and 4-kinase-domain-containing protein [Syncephalis plumigaleata]
MQRPHSSNRNPLHVLSSTPPRKSKVKRPRRRYWLPLFIAPPRPRLTVPPAATLAYHQANSTLSLLSTSSHSTLKRTSATPPPWLDSHNKPIVGTVMVDQLSTRSTPHLVSNSLKSHHSSTPNLRSRRNTNYTSNRNSHCDDDNDDDEILSDDDEETSVHRPLLPKASVNDKASPTRLDGRSDLLTSNTIEADPLISSQHRIPPRNRRRSYAVIYEPRYTPIDLFNGTMSDYFGHPRRRNDQSSPVLTSSPIGTTMSAPVVIRNRSTKSKYKGRKRRINIRHTVFQPLPGELESWQKEITSSTPFHEPVSNTEFNQIIDGVKMAIRTNIYPEINGQGSSEAAAFLLDQRLGLNIVPRTNVVQLASPSFYYGKIKHKRMTRENNEEGLTYIDEQHSYLPEKVGSFQLFVDGYEDASKFFTNHPWTDQDEDVTMSEESEQSTSKEDTRTFQWTSAIKKQFQEEFEKLVVLDYLMRNTDRGMDNWMIKLCTAPDEHPVEWTTSNEDNNQLVDTSTDQYNEAPNTTRVDRTQHDTSTNVDHYLIDMNESTSANVMASHSGAAPVHLHIAAIDNGLAFPWKHPDQWRSYPFGWLNLPQTLTETPFSTYTRQALLPKLTSHRWWERTSRMLYELFRKDEDFNEKMFSRQLSVIKGQAWNLVECLRDPTKGPVHLCDQTAVVVIEEKEEEIDPSYATIAANDRDVALSEAEDRNATGTGMNRATGLLARFYRARPRRSLQNIRRAASIRSQRSRRSTRSVYEPHATPLEQSTSSPQSQPRRRYRQRVRERLKFLTRIRPCFTWC